MEKVRRFVTINTYLKDFVLLDRITLADAEDIRGIKAFENAPVYLGLEALAQLGAFHVRYLTVFERHAFLLKITRCVMPAREKLNGVYELSGKPIGRSGLAFSHILTARKDETDVIEGEFMFATVDYNRNFRKEILQDHYRKVFSCLRNGMKAD